MKSDNGNTHMNKNNKKRNDTYSVPFIGRLQKAFSESAKAFHESWKNSDRLNHPDLPGQKKTESKNSSRLREISHRLVPEIELNFPVFKNEEYMTESEICVKCHGCCSYVTADIEKPDTAMRREEYKWYLHHRNTEIYIDNEGSWQLLFKTPCNELDENGFCLVYETRPQICRDYSAEYCSRTGKDHTHLFKTPDEMTAYLNETDAAKKKVKKTVRKKKSVNASVKTAKTVKKKSR